MVQSRLSVLNIILASALLLGRWAARADSAYDEGVDAGRADFLRGAVVPYRDWRTADFRLTRSEISALQPDSVLRRRYRSSDGGEAELTVVAGNRKRSLRIPDYGLPPGYWEEASQSRTVLQIAGREVPAVRSFMRNSDGRAMLSTYFLTDGVDNTASELAFQRGRVEKIVRMQVPLGAMVRISVPVSGRIEAADRLTAEFAAAVVPPVWARLRAARAGWGGAAR